MKNEGLPILHAGEPTFPEPEQVLTVTETDPQALSVEAKTTSTLDDQEKVAALQSELGIPTKQAGDESYEDRLQRITTERKEKNEKILLQAKEILIMKSEDLCALQDEQLFTMLKNLRWDRYVNDESKKVPEKIMDAEAHIYSAYSPSKELQKIHEEANKSALRSFDPKELFQLNEKWKSMTVEEKLAELKSYTDKLHISYGMPPITIAVYPEPFGSESAQWMRSHLPDSLGVLILYESDLGKISPGGALQNVSHEMGHAYQEAMIKKLVPISDTMKRDATWFKAYFDKEPCRSTEEYRAPMKRYRAIPTEADAWMMQNTAPTELARISKEYADNILLKNNLPSLEDIRMQSAVATWLTRNLDNGLSAENLVEEAQKKLPRQYVEPIRIATEGKNITEIRATIQSIKETQEKANELLGLAA